MATGYVKKDRLEIWWEKKQEEDKIKKWKSAHREVSAEEGDEVI